MRFVEHDDMIQTTAAYAADNSFTIRILPGRAWRDWDFFNTHAFDTLGEVVPVDAVAIANEKTRCFLVREGVDDLLDGPFGVGIRRDVEVNDLPPVVAEHDEDVQDTEGHGRNREEVAGGDVGSAIPGVKVLCRDGAPTANGEQFSVPMVARLVDALHARYEASEPNRPSESRQPRRVDPEASQRASWGTQCGVRMSPGLCRVRSTPCRTACGRPWYAERTGSWPS